MDALGIGPVEELIFLLVFAILAGSMLRPRRRRSQWRPRQPDSDFRRLIRGPRPTLAQAHSLVAPASTDPAEQLRAVMAGSFTAKRVLSRTEAQVMRAAEAAIAEAGLPWRVMAQVALGEVLASPDEAAFRAINAKRVDLLVISAKSEPLAAIEYQGQGHWQGSAPARDAIKKEALRKAGVRYVEITPDDGPADVRREIGRLAMLAAGAASREHRSVGQKAIAQAG